MNARTREGGGGTTHTCGLAKRWKAKPKYQHKKYNVLKCVCCNTSPEWKEHSFRVSSLGALSSVAIIPTASSGCPSDAFHVTVIPVIFCYGNVST